MNKYDTNKISSYLLKSFKKCFIINSIDKSDLVILNTCSVRQKAQNKFYSYFDIIKKIKKINNKLIVIVCGCIATYDRKDIFIKFPEIDIVFSSNKIKKLPVLINNFKKFKKKIFDVDFKNNYDKNINNYLDKSNYSYINSFVSIIEGCNKCCSYCVVPITKGKEFSRPPMDIISEICYLSKNGVSEINLLGQNVNAYLGIFENGKKCTFSNLLNLISEIDEIKRIKFTTSHPINFTDDLILSYKNIHKIVDFVHLPIQSGSNKILRYMRRNYTVEYYNKIVDKLLNIRPKLIFGSDFIVGFPGESNKDFNLTIDLVNKIKFDSSFAFIYSPRPGTKSFNMIDNISYNEKKNRLYKLLELLRKNSIFWSNTMLNTEQEILVEGYTKKKDFLFGRARNNKIIYFNSNKNNNLIGKLINIKINKINKNMLYGKLVNI